MPTHPARFSGSNWFSPLTLTHSKAAAGSHVVLHLRLEASSKVALMCAGRPV